MIAAGAFHVAFASPALSFLILVFLFGLMDLSKLGTNRRAFYFGLAVGLAVYAPQLGFFWTIFGGGAVALWCVPAFWLGLFVVLTRQCRLRFGKWGTVLLTPVVWTGLEYFRSELYYLRFSWLDVGYAFSDQFRVLGRLGVYGVGFGLMLALGILSVLPRKAALAVGGALAVALAALCGNWPTWRASVRPTGSEVRVAGVQMEFPPPAEVPFVLDRLIGRCPAADLFVLSEYTFDGPVPEPVLRWCREHRRYLIVGGKELVSAGDFYDTAFVISPAGEVVFRQAKSVPIQFFKDGFPARGQKLWDSPWGRIGLGICYDLSYRQVTDRLVGLGAQAIIVPTMDLVDWGKHQHQLHARIAPVRAAEYGLPVLRVASSGISQLVEADGMVSATAPFGGEQSILTGVLHLPAGGSLPVDHYLAPVCVWATGVLVLWLGLTALRRRPGSLRPLFHFLLRVLFRYRAYDLEALRTPGPVLLIPNHVSWIDWLFLWVHLEEDWRFVVSGVAAQYSWVHRLILLNRYTFPIDPMSPYAVKRMSEFLHGGGRLVLFAEGQISHTGTLMKLYEGTGFLLFRTQAKVITCYLRGANRLRWSRQPGWRRWWPRITAHFSAVARPPRMENLRASEARVRLTQWLWDRMVGQQFDIETEFGPANVLDAVVETARRQPRKIVLQDFTMQPLRYRRLLVGVDLLASRLEATLTPEPQRVGVLLPNVNATPVTILAVWAVRKVPAMLNYSLGTPMMLSCARLAGLKQVVTSQAFLERVRLSPEPFAAAGLELIFLEELRSGISPVKKFGAMLRQALFPGAGLRRGACRSSEQVPRDKNSRIEPLTRPSATLSHPMGEGWGLPEFDHRPHRESGASESSVRSGEAEASSPRLAPPLAAEEREQSPAAVILFTSGSEGVPKGVELTHANLLANIRQMLAVTDIEDRDRLFNALPLFHSFGLTVGTLLGLVRGLYVFLYPSPLHYRLVPTLFYDRTCTIFLSTNTFLNGYARKANPYDFRSLRYLFAAGEKLQEPTAATWSERFGIRVLEGYGATECSPCVSVNTPLIPRHGTVGRLLPGMEYKLEPVEGVADGGRLLVRGPNVMRGYLNADADAAFQALGGWYDTGDIVSVDEAGYVRILGRLKRFAKVSGEMVSLTAVEDALAGAFPQYGLRCQVAVVAQPDADKGEALIAMTNESRLELGEIRAALRARGLPNLCVPREVRCVREIPKLGTGKIDHRALATLIKGAGCERDHSGPLAKGASR